jgi:hypothetical protein
LVVLQVMILSQHCSLLCVLLIHLPQRPLGSINDFQKKLSKVFIISYDSFHIVFVGYFSALVWVNYIMPCQWFPGICIFERENMVMSDE